MEHVVIGLDEELAPQTSVDWVIERARSKPMQIRLVAAVDVDASSPGAARDLAADAAGRIQNALPATPVETTVTDSPMLRELLERSEAADLLVIGSHPDPGIRDSRTPSFAVSLAARAHCAVVIVPDDWQARGGPVVVGVDSTGTSGEVVAFAAREAVAAGRELEIVHTWEPWNAQKTRSAQRDHQGILDATIESIRAEFPGLRVRGVLSEAVAHAGVIASSQDAHLIVLGTHGLGRETGLVLGAIHQEVMIHGGIALCIVPLAQVSQGPDEPTSSQGN